MDWENEIDGNFEEARSKRSVTTCNDWLLKAIEQKNAHLTVGVANSKLLVYDKIDQHLFASINCN